MPVDTSGRSLVFPVRDLELLHHYTAYSYQLMTHEAEHMEIWQIQVPRLAFQNQFLLHGILSLTALHKWHWAADSEKVSLIDLARYHQQHALTEYIPLLQAINEKNCHALFCFSIVLTVMTFAMLEHDAEPDALISHFLDCIDTLMGCNAIATEAKDWLLAGPFHVILTAIVPMSDNLDALSEEPRQALEALLKSADDVCRSFKTEGLGQEAAMNHSAYSTAILGLASVMAPPPGERQLGVVVSWPTITGYEYIALLKRKDPLALVILGHYGVALHIYGQAWILAGLGKRLTEAVVREVDPSWRPHLKWAEARVSQPVV